MHGKRCIATTRIKKHRCLNIVESGHDVCAMHGRHTPSLLRKRIAELEADLEWLHNSTEEDGKRIASYGGIGSTLTLLEAVRAARNSGR